MSMLQRRYERLIWVNIQKHVWGGRQSSRRFDLLRTRLKTKACMLISWSIVFSRMSIKSELCCVVVTKSWDCCNCKEIKQAWFLPAVSLFWGKNVLFVHFEHRNYAVNSISCLVSYSKLTDSARKRMAFIGEAGGFTFYPQEQNISL